MTHPEVRGQWMAADNSRNALEVAPTEQDGLFAIRDSYTQGEVIFATNKQLRNLADSIQEGRLKLANQ